MAIGGPRGGPDKPTLRQDSWWVEPVVTVVVLTAFVVYSTWAAFVSKDYYAGAGPAPQPDLALLLPLPRPAAACRAATPSGRWLTCWHYLARRS